MDAVAAPWAAALGAGTTPGDAAITGAARVTDATVGEAVGVPMAFGILAGAALPGGADLDFGLLAGAALRAEVAES